jgi:hypothetical protein
MNLTSMPEWCCQDVLGQLLGLRQTTIVGEMSNPKTMYLIEFQVSILTE